MRREESLGRVHVSQKLSFEVVGKEKLSIECGLYKTNDYSLPHGSSIGAVINSE